ncbi:MAG: leucine-rich repeat domain-containing protein, partial [Mycobacterium sp.]|nr:leucine-rich repeat domain-containing protein [Mycobacterium sp.]
MSSSADAAGTDVVNIPDANLKAALNAELGHAADQDITEADALTVTRVLSAPGPIADLTGLQAFPNLAEFDDRARGNTFTDLTPLSGLTKITRLSLNNGVLTSADLTPLQSMTGLQTLNLAGNQIASAAPLSPIANLTTLTLDNNQIANVAPLSGLTNLTTLSLDNNQIANVAPLSGLTNLTALNLDNNKIRDLSGLPALPRATFLSLSNNNIQDPSPLVDKLTGAAGVLATLNLSNNKITDVTSLAPLGQNTALLGNATSLSTGLMIEGNRIADLSPLSTWKKPPTSFNANGQSVFVGPYQDGGVHVTLKTSNGAAVSIDPSVGSYDAGSGTLTLVDPAAAMATVKPNWTVFFSNPPIDPGDTNGPTITGTAQVGQVLTASDPGATLAGCPVTSLSYQWLRDGNPIVGNPHFKNSTPPAFGDMGGPGVESTYDVSATDLGHQLSVELTCNTSGVESTSAPTPVVTTTEPDLPVIQDLDGGSIYHSAFDGVTISPDPLSGVVGDPTNPT